MTRYFGAATALVVVCTAGYAWAQQPEMGYKDAREFVLRQLEQRCQNEFRQSVETKRASDRRFGMARSEQELQASARIVPGDLVGASASKANEALNEANANADFDGPFAGCIWKRRVEDIANNGGVTPPWPRVGDVAVRTTVAAAPASAPVPAPAPAPVSNTGNKGQLRTNDGRDCIEYSLRSGAPSDSGQIMHTWTFKNVRGCPAIDISIYHVGDDRRIALAKVVQDETDSWWCLEGPKLTSQQCIGGELEFSEAFAR